MSDTIPLLAGLAITIAAAKLAGTVAARFGQPTVIGKLLIGILLGPSVFGIFSYPYFADAHVLETLREIGEIGVIFLMFVAGLEVNLDEFAKAGRAAGLAGTMGVFFPIVLGTATAMIFGYGWDRALFIGIVLAATSVSISAQTLMEMGRLRSREGLTLLGAAVVDDVLAIIILSLFSALAAPHGATGLIGIAEIIGRMALFFGIAFAAGKWALPQIVARADRLRVSEATMAAVIVLVLTFSWASEAIGEIAAITGAFVVGVALARSHLHRQISAGMHVMAYSLFVPVFLVSIGLAANFRDLSSADMGLAFAICLVAVVSKLLGGGLGAKAGGMTWPESLRVGAGMVSRGEVGLIIAGVGVSIGFADNNVFAVAVVMVLFTTIIAPALLRFTFRG